MPIHLLSPLVVNQIAAGEVVERPASVVKELVENSIDAEATRINVEIENGGRDLILINDDGVGIPMDELSLAVAAHATSKITQTEDLNAIASLGFRGEALASIGAISRMSLVSRTKNDTGAARIDIEGDKVDDPKPSPGPLGTTITVRNLFFNTPGRRKFLRTDQTETTRISQTVEKLALSHPQIGFTFTTNKRKTIDLAPTQHRRERVLEILGRELDGELLELDVNERGIGMWGMIGKPAIARGTNRHMQVFLNGRSITDRSITHAIKEAYRGLIDPTRHPTIVLFMQMDPAMVDVNVHPTKAEVRFRNQAAVHGAVLSAVRNRLREDDLTPTFDLSRPGVGSLSIPGFKPEFASGVGSGGGGSSSQESTSQFVDYFRRLDPLQKGFIYSEVKEVLAESVPELLDDDNAKPQAAQDMEVLPMVRAVEDVLQIHSSFLVTQDEHGLLIIDQHALHERVMFEKLKEAIGKGNLESQRLLMPAPVDIDASQMELLVSLKPLLDRIGIEAEQIGPAAIGINAFSSFLFERGVEPAEFILELFNKASAEGLNNDTEAALHEVLDMMACKAAIKAGDKLTTQEITDLLRQREIVERSSNCPHGRPTTLRLSIEELEKQFGRR
ncbi:MAG: DNA mismatch repair endonuclease MutL [Planctomycetes bacterium]|nr:DNA mismatch repair endonuclease MutL [Planctomycetota bacterium]